MQCAVRADGRQPRPKHEVVNLWTRAMDHTTQAIRDFFGIQQSYPLPYGGPVYQGRNSVDRRELAGGPKPDWLWRVENGKFYYLFEGDKIESRDLVYWTADKVLPRLQAQGLKRIFFEPVHESDFTELAFACHAETGWHGDLYCSSVCGSHRYVRPSSSVAGRRGTTWRTRRAGSG